jgi:superfamily II DNA or RNA helicase
MSSVDGNVAQLVEMMNCSVEDAKRALKRSKGDIDMAMEQLLDPTLSAAAAAAEILSSDDEPSAPAPATVVQGSSLSSKMKSNAEKFGLDFCSKPVGSDDEAAKAKSPVQQPIRSFADRVQKVTKPVGESSQNHHTSTNARPMAGSSNVISLDSDDDDDEPVVTSSASASAAAQGLSFKSRAFMPAGSRTTSTADTGSANDDIEMHDDPELAAAASTYVRKTSNFERKTWFSANQPENRVSASAAASSSTFGQAAGSSGTAASTFSQRAGPTMGLSLGGGFADRSALPAKKFAKPAVFQVKPGYESGPSLLSRIQDKNKRPQQHSFRAGGSQERRKIQLVEGVHKLDIDNRSGPSRSPSGSPFQSLSSSSPIDVASGSGNDLSRGSLSESPGNFSPGHPVQEVPTPTNNGRASIDSAIIREKNEIWGNLTGMNPAGANRFNAVDVDEVEGTENNAIVFAGDDDSSDESLFAQPTRIDRAGQVVAQPLESSRRKRVSYPRNLTLELSDAKNLLDEIRREREVCDHDREDVHKTIGNKERQREEYINERNAAEDEMRRIQREIDHHKVGGLFSGIADRFMGTPSRDNAKDLRLQSLQEKLDTANNLVRKKNSHLVAVGGAIKTLNLKVQSLDRKYDSLDFEYQDQEQVCIDMEEHMQKVQSDHVFISRVVGLVTLPDFIDDDTKFMDIAREATVLKRIEIKEDEFMSAAELMESDLAKVVPENKRRNDAYITSHILELGKGDAIRIPIKVWKDAAGVYKNVENEVVVTSPFDILRLALGDTSASPPLVVAGGQKEALNFRKRALGLHKETEKIPPRSVASKLRSYQDAGFKWMANLTHNGLGALLADDMGLGKTLQAITLILWAIENGEFKKRKGFSGSGSAPSNAASSAASASSSAVQNKEPEKKTNLKWFQRNRPGLGGAKIHRGPQGLPATAPALEDKPISNAILVIVPAMLLNNWKREFTKWAPHLKLTMLADSKTKSIHLQSSDVVLVSYERCRRIAQDPKSKNKSNKKNDPSDPLFQPKSPATKAKKADPFLDRNWAGIIIDEAQRIKNPRAQQSRAVKKLATQSNDFRVALSGTPVENKLEELHSIFEFVNPSYFGSLIDFKERFVKPREKADKARQKRLDTWGEDSEARASPDEAAGKEAQELLRRLVDPFLLRRLKTDKDLLPDLPDAVTYDVKVELAEGQRAIYTAVTERFKKELEKMKKVEPPYDKLSKGELKKKRSGLIFGHIAICRLICGHPHTIDPDRVPVEVRGHISDGRNEASGKMKWLIEFVDEHILPNPIAKGIIFFTRKNLMYHVQANLMTKFPQIETITFSGDVKMQEREKLMDKFQNNAKTRLILIIIEAGGVGTIFSFFFK